MHFPDRMYLFPQYVYPQYCALWNFGVIPTFFNIKSFNKQIKYVWLTLTGSFVKFEIFVVILTIMAYCASGWFWLCGFPGWLYSELFALKFPLKFPQFPLNSAFPPSPAGNLEQLKPPCNMQYITF